MRDVGSTAEYTDCFKVNLSAVSMDVKPTCLLVRLPGKAGIGGRTVNLCCPAWLRFFSRAILSRDVKSRSDGFRVRVKVSDATCVVVTIMQPEPPSGVGSYGTLVALRSPELGQTVNWPVRRHIWMTRSEAKSDTAANFCGDAQRRSITLTCRMLTNLPSLNDSMYNLILRPFLPSNLLNTLVVSTWIVCGSVRAEQPTFNQHIRPILAENCFACHGLDEGSRKADLRLDERSIAIELGAIKPGVPDESDLMARVESDDSETIMPPPDSRHKLSVNEIDLLRQWITQGAKYEKHWSFTPPVKIEPPQPQTDWSSHPIDRFVLQRLEAEGLNPNQEAERLRLIRRLSLDLTGLPPSVEQADAFLADGSPEAYESLVDQLLESDAYGEHWARMWLDLARYADTKGYEKDRPRTIWRYRDWVIDALNRDLPYDQFAIEQLAGDLLPEPTQDQILATAFHRNTMENDEGGTDDEEFRVAAVKDRVDTTVQVWMGLTIGCAKCHSHKYDPISQQDYYALYAFFNQTEDADRPPPTVPTPTISQRKKIESLNDELKTLEQQTAQDPEGYAAAWEEWRTQFSDGPLWTPLLKSKFESDQNVTLNQEEDGTFVVVDEAPAKDTWKLTLQFPSAQTLTALRITTQPKPSGGKWQDKNVVLRELTAELIEDGKEPVKLKLDGARADFSQKGWEVAKAIDGKTNTGWAFSPKAAVPHCAIFELSELIEMTPKRRLRLTLEQEYGQGLILQTFQIAGSSYPGEWLTTEPDPNAGLETVFRKQVFPGTMDRYAQIEAKRNELKTVRGEVPSTPIMRELPEAKQRVTKLHRRGNFLEQGDVVEARLPSAFGRLPDGSPRNRLGVAQWLMHSDNPLTARVTVNRIWAQLFGIGFVETEEDFGTQGTLPSHPELLDWLAVDFRENGWSLKQLLKTVVMSNTYRQSSATNAKHLQVDPRNRLLARGPRFRLSAETVRDQALAASGLLTRQIGGPSVMPPQPGGIWKSTYNGDKWHNATGANRYRRALYTYRKRTSPYPAMTTFDSGSGEICLIRRVRTNTPLQALVTLNDTAYVEAAGALAMRMEKSAESTRDQIANGFRMVLIRHADPAELDRLVELYDSLQEDLADGNALLKSAGLTSGDPRLVAVANVLLNLDESLIKP